MESETPSIISMTDEQFSGHVESLSPDEAQGQIEAVQRAAAKDPLHAYNQKGGADHKRIVERLSRYYEAKHAGDDPGVEYNAAGEELRDRISPDMQKMAADAMASQAAKQNRLKAEGERLLTELESLGLTNDNEEITFDKDQIAILRMQVLNEKGDFRALGQEISTALRDTKDSASMKQLFDVFISAEDMDVELKSSISHQIISYLHKAAVAKREYMKNTGFGGAPIKAKTEAGAEFNFNDYR